MVKKRLSAFITDMVLTTVTCACLIYLPMVFVAVSMLLFLPWVLTYTDTANTILLRIGDIILLVGTIIYMFTLMKISQQTRGYKAYQLKVKGINRIRLFTRWFIRTGIFGVAFFLYFYFLSHNIDFNYLLFILYPYLAYLIVNVIILVHTKGKKSLIDIWVGSEVIVTDEKPKVISIIKRG
ncbi:hypothetical protein [Oceanobacillus sp. J11TS1]|uniref:hypothetical protein n=1 Tax=Oceanobacillus sp. J11TS1 TaxID=2807191 RepID=UPI001B0708BA|nr:hypothetical protein [Oceanobacillus sp. J11TS1]GIO21506.1 hypothetical protein J11TS1_00870 [Oceanobacillus sp. J11TS1]